MRSAASVPISILLLAWLGASSRAEEADWRFCVAADYQTHVAYLTPPFESDATGKDLEARVGAMLTRENLPFQNVQCRLPTDLPQSEAERDDAHAFVKALGFKLENLQ